MTVYIVEEDSEKAAIYTLKREMQPAYESLVELDKNEIVMVTEVEAPEEDDLDD